MFDDDSFSAKNNQSSGLSALLSGICALLNNRAALFVLEMQEQKNNLTCAIFGVLLSLVLLFIGLVSLLILLAILTPSEWRVTLMFTMFILFGFAGIFVAWNLRRRIKQKPLPFSMLFSELKKDLELLKRRR